MATGGKAPLSPLTPGGWRAHDRTDTHEGDARENSNMIEDGR